MLFKPKAFSDNKINEAHIDEVFFGGVEIIVGKVSFSNNDFNSLPPLGLENFEKSGLWGKELSSIHCWEQHKVNNQ